MLLSQRSRRLGQETNVLHPCHPVFHAALHAIGRPFRPTVHRVIGHRSHHAGLGRAPVHAPQPMPAQCIRLPGALPVGPGLLPPALGVIGAVGAWSVAAVLAAGLAVAGLAFGSGANGTAAQSPSRSATSTFSGAEFETTPALTLNAAGNVFAGSTTWDLSLATIGSAGGDSSTLPSMLSMPLSTMPTTASPFAETPGSEGPRLATLPASGSPALEATPEHPTSVPEPTSLAILAAGSVAAMLFEAAARRTPPQSMQPGQVI